MVRNGCTQAFALVPPPLWRGGRRPGRPGKILHAMAVITGLDNQTRKRNVIVALDGEASCEISRKLAAEVGLRVGKDIDEAWLVQLAHEDNVRYALERAARLLEIRSRGSQEMARSLKQRGFGDAVITEAVARLVKLGVIDDTQFATEFINSRGRAHPQSVRRTRSELASRGVGKAAIDDAVAGIGEIDELSLARAALAKRARSLPADKDERKKVRQRLATFLAGLGFGWDIVRQALAEVFEATDSDDDD